MNLDWNGNGVEVGWEWDDESGNEKHRYGGILVGCEEMLAECGGMVWMKQHSLILFLFFIF